MQSFVWYRGSVCLQWRVWQKRMPLQTFNQPLCVQGKPNHLLHLESGPHVRLPISNICILFLFFSCRHCYGPGYLIMRHSYRVVTSCHEALLVLLTTSCIVRHCNWPLHLHISRHCYELPHMGYLILFSIISPGLINHFDGLCSQHRGGQGEGIPTLFFFGEVGRWKATGHCSPEIQHDTVHLRHTPLGHQSQLPCILWCTAMCYLISSLFFMCYLISSLF